MSQGRPVGGEIKPGVSLKPVQNGGRSGRSRKRGGTGKKKWRGPFGLNKWQTVAAAFAALAVAVVVFIGVIAATLPDPSQVQVHAGEVKIYDRSGATLVADVQGGGEQRQEVALDKIS